MSSLQKKIIIAKNIFLLSFSVVFSQSLSIDDLDNAEGWNFIRSDGVELALSVEEGLKGNAIRFDYDFTKGTGYGGIQKWFPIDLPGNYELTFWVKAESPDNNFEIKFDNLHF